MHEKAHSEVSGSLKRAPLHLTLGDLNVVQHFLKRTPLAVSVLHVQTDKIQAFSKAFQKHGN